MNRLESFIGELLGLAEGLDLEDAVEGQVTGDCEVPGGSCWVVREAQRRSNTGRK